MSTEPRTSVDALLGRLDRVRSLARRLVRDAAEADDLVQEAVAAALSRPTTMHGAGDGWITATLRNLVRDRARRMGRRDRREKAVARPESGGHDTSTLIENAERQRDVVEAVLSLEDPYRETLLMRFFEDLPPREIVKRTGRSPETVKKHIARGLSQLRAKLEARYGGRGQWAVALLPIVGRGGLANLSVGATVAVPPIISLRIAAALAVVLGVGVPAYMVWHDGARSGGDASTEILRRSKGVAAPALAAVGTAGNTRAAVAESQHVAHGSHDDSTTAPAPVEPTGPQPVRLVHLTGEPFALTNVEWTWARTHHYTKDQPEHVVSFTTDEAGRAVIDGPRFPNLPEGPWRIEGKDHVVAGYVTSEDDPTLLLAPSVRIAGRVIDDQGQPFEGASVHLIANPRDVPGYVALDGRIPSGGYQNVVVGPGGTFSIDNAPTHPAFRIVVDADGYRRSRQSIPAIDTFDLELGIGKALPLGRFITGTVLEASGAPSALAKVRFGQHDTTCDAQGRFRLQIPLHPLENIVSAQAEDGRFAFAPSPVDSGKIASTDREGVVEDAVVLRLPESMATLAGRLVDARGAAASRYEVHVLDGTVIGSSTSRFETGGYVGEVHTDGDGRFVLEPVLDRPYTIRFVDRKTMHVFDSCPLQPGADEHTIVMPGDMVVDVLRGHVVDARGEPVRGAEVSLEVSLQRRTDRTRNMYSGRETVTDEDGRFEIEDSPWRHLAIKVNPRPGTNYYGVTTEIGDGRPDESIEVVVELDCNVRLSVAREDVDRVTVLDAAGEQLDVKVKTPGRTTFTSRVKRAEDGTFPTFDVSQGAAFLVLRRGIDEVDRVPVRLEVNGENVIDL